MKRLPRAAGFIFKNTSNVTHDLSLIRPSRCIAAGDTSNRSTPGGQSLDDSVV
ncbi:hypothetical protein [Mesorhizobium sp. RMAD-H1]|uniref:hypothetical protein n=1 Tax=Mesorhizobium sp. RMAD-H1 TaxID=2587065 RepID=UPI001619E27E|nr:hypothetical protein [Mesorhizobium sp. RMAD-H1]MBB2973220.1 hypothetical protein [Mesorhizobium sp. RMAD-H1]